MHGRIKIRGNLQAVKSNPENLRKGKHGCRSGDRFWLVRIQFFSGKNETKSQDNTDNQESQESQERQESQESQ